MVGVPMHKAERISRSGPKLSDAQTRNFEAIKHTSLPTACPTASIATFSVMRPGIDRPTALREKASVTAAR